MGRSLSYNSLIDNFFKSHFASLWPKTLRLAKNMQSKRKERCVSRTAFCLDSFAPRHKLIKYFLKEGVKNGRFFETT